MDDAEPRPRPRPTSRIVPVLILIIGGLFFLLVFSVGFNAWFLMGGQGPFGRMQDAIRAEHEARLQQERAAAMAELAQAQEMRARQAAEQARQAAAAEVDALKKEIERLKPAPEPREVPAIKDNQLWGSLEGRVVFKGELPKIESLAEKIRKHADAKHLLKAPPEELLDPTWRIDEKSRGVANVCVFIKRPANNLLPIHPDDAVREEPVVLDAPFAAFVPHMSAFYPRWNDGQSQGNTGQKFLVKNSSPIPHGARLVGNPAFNPDLHHGRNLPAKTQNEYTLKAQPLPIMVQCDVHPWMQAYVWVFDHPYFAITKADGTFTIPRVPAGMDVSIMAWQESQGWLLTKNGREMTLKAGKNRLDLEIGVK